LGYAATAKITMNKSAAIFMRKHVMTVQIQYLRRNFNIQEGGTTSKQGKKCKESYFLL
jgi:hypothetical protein